MEVKLLFCDVWIGKCSYMGDGPYPVGLLEPRVLPGAVLGRAHARLAEIGVAAVDGREVEGGGQRRLVPFGGGAVDGDVGGGLAAEGVEQVALGGRGDEVVALLEREGEEGVRWAGERVGG